MKKNILILIFLACASFNAHAMEPETAPAEQKQQICNLPACSKPAPKKCAECGVFYCSADCQKNDINRHMPHCFETQATFPVLTEEHIIKERYLRVQMIGLRNQNVPQTLQELQTYYLKLLETVDGYSNAPITTLNTADRTKAWAEFYIELANKLKDEIMKRTTA